MRCTACDAELILTNVVPENTLALCGFEHHTFICSGCHIRVRRIVFTRQSAHSLGLQFHVLNASTDQDIDTVFAGLVRQQIGVLLVSADPLFLGRRVEVAALAAHYAVPVIYFAREFVAAGGLMSYGTSIGAAYRQAGLYTGKILKGVKPADLPVVQPTKFDLVINLKTAKALGITVPPMLLARADEVIE